MKSLNESDGRGGAKEILKIIGVMWGIGAVLASFMLITYLIDKLGNALFTGG